MNKRKFEIEFIGAKRIEEGNLLEFDVNQGNIQFTVIQKDDDYSKVTDVLNIFVPIKLGDKGK